MRVLLTGATGFIGSHVTRELLHRGYEVHVSLRPSSDCSRILDLLDRIRIWEEPFDQVPMWPDATIHLAWVTTPGKYLESPENEELLAASRRLIERVPGRAIFAGTCFEYDTQRGVLAEDSPTRPTTLYARCKDELRKTVERRPNSAWVRLFYQYGPGEHPDRFIPSVIRSLLSEKPVKVSPGAQRRDFLHVRDVAAAIAAVLESDLQGCVNIGSGRAVEQRRMVAKLSDLAGRLDLVDFGAVPYFPGEPMLIEADTTKLGSTGWRPKVDLETGLSETFEWWRAALTRPSERRILR